jgi:hypothetical protein
MRLKRIKSGSYKLTEAKARIIAHLIGDGAHYRTKHDYVLKYEVRDYELLRQFYRDILSVYGLKASWEWNTSGKTGKPIRFVRLRSILAYKDILRYSTYYSRDWNIKEPILTANEGIRKEFLTALFDDEGSVKSKYEITLYSINRAGLQQIKKMLVRFGLQSRIVGGFGQKRDVYGLYINDLKKFREKIGFSLKRKEEKLSEMIKLR